MKKARQMRAFKIEDNLSGSEFQSMPGKSRSNSLRDY
jgi:hypothetical protein